MKKLSLFTKARLKLTAYYIIIFITISGVISGLFYYRTGQVLEAEYQRIERRFQMEINGMTVDFAPGPPIHRIDAEDIEIAKQKIVLQLLSINGMIAILVALSGYVLSGLTLAPLEASMEQQKRFVSDAAHELKTPLTALRTSLEVNLMDDELEKKPKQILEENLEDVKSLDQLITSMLMLSKINEQPLEKEIIDLKTIITKAKKYTDPQAKAKKIKLVQKLPTKNIYIRGNEPALTDVVKIILENAIKYSPAKTQITLSASIKRATVELSIADQGPGISKQDLSHIFDRFYRADVSRTKNADQAGYGLGLSIAKTIVEHHQGKITATSTLSKGSTFTVVLPTV